MVWAGVVLQCLHLQAEAAVHRSDVTLRSSVRSVQMRGRLREVTHPWPFLALNLGSSLHLLSQDMTGLCANLLCSVSE